MEPLRDRMTGEQGDKLRFKDRVREITDLGLRHRALDDLLTYISNPKDHEMPSQNLLSEISGDIQAIAYPSEEYDRVLSEIGESKIKPGSGIGGSMVEMRLRRLAVTDVARYIENSKQDPEKTPPDYKVLVTAAPLMRRALMELEKRLNGLVVQSIDLNKSGRFIEILVALVGGRSEYGKKYLLDELQDILERNTTTSRFDKTVTKDVIVELLEETGIEKERIERVLKTKPLA